MNKKITFIIAILILGFLFSLSLAKSPTLEFTILHSNDFHGADMELLAKRATMIKNIRAESNHPVLVVDTGDIFGRGPYAKRFYGELEFAVLNKLHYDVIVLGNNEFKATKDQGSQQILLDRVRQARFPVLAGNVFVEKSNTLLPGVKPYVIKEVNGVKIGLLGLTSTKINSYNQVQGWHCADPISTGKRLFSNINKEADIVIALTHIGFDLDRVLAERLPGLSAIVGGDSHTILLNPVIINEIPIVQAGDYGYYLGKLDLTFEKKGQNWVLNKVSGQLIEMDDEQIQPDPEIQKLIKGYLERPKEDAA